jgi:cobalt/nickel transport system permease protein
MHMADALVSPAVGGAMWAATAATTAVASRRVQAGVDDRRVPLMGVLGAFVFAAQMVNFQIPLTGSSGHIGGALLLAILLGPHAAFLVVVSVLAIQALLFGDGGLLALGANAFNIGFFPAFVAYPLVYRPLAPAGAGPARRTTAALVAAEVGLVLGALGVVCETSLSGVSELPFRPFLLAMVPIHLAIGLVEGLVTAAVLTFVLRVRPDVVDPASSPAPTVTSRLGAAFLAAALLLGGVVSWFASKRPDGLEWSIAKVSGHAASAEADATRGATSLAGIGGGLVTLGAVSAAGWALRRRS